MALIVCNEIKDKTRSIQVFENQIVNFEQLLTKARAKIAKLQATAARLEAGSSGA